jgi:ferric-dicitrate binding protein FerR (iron transport regulator)
MSLTNNGRELSELLGALCDGAITSEQFAQLEQLLRSDPNARDCYVDYMMLCGELKQTIPLCPEQPVLPPANKPNKSEAHGQEIKEWAKHITKEEQWKTNARKESIRQSAENLFRQYEQEEKRRQEELLYKAHLARRRRLIVGFSSLAAFLAIMLSTWFASKPQTQTASDQPVAQRPVAQPIVATVTKLSEARWENTTEITWNTELEPGPLHLIQGYAEITFKSQAKVIIEAPTKINLVNENAARLDSGILTAHVPKPAQGFAVTTSSVLVTDLGTEFGLMVNKDGVTEVHVLTGEVKASFTPDVNDASLQPSRTLHENVAMRFDAQTGTAHAISLDREYFPVSWHDVLYKPRLSRGIVFERSMPASIGKGDFMSDDTVYIFLERAGLTLSEALAVNITTPGTHSYFRRTLATVHAGSVVDSYLIHWHPLSAIGQSQSKKVDIRFPRSILALIVDTAQLEASDKICGHPQTQYPENERLRHLESGSETQIQDQVIMTQDRLNLNVTLKASTYDQLRVLIASPTNGGGLSVQQ